MNAKKGRLVVALVAALSGGLLPVAGQAGERIVKPWVVGYLPGDWQKTDGSLNILTDNDWNTITHIVHFAAEPNDDGTLSFDAGSEGKMSATKRAAAITLAHSKGIPILFCLNDWIDLYKPVLSDASKRQNLINGLISVLKEGYDGLDIDLEPITPYGSSTHPIYETFMNELHAKMKLVNKTNNPKMIVERPLFTLAAGSDAREAPLLMRLIDKLDKINVMTYDMSTIWQCTIWHDSALYDGGNKYASTGQPLISASGTMQKYLDAGIPASKLTLGLSLEARIWQGGKMTGTTTGAVLPTQYWATEGCDTSSNRPLNWNDGTTPREGFAEMMKNRYQPAYYRWDKTAKSAYMSIDQTGTANDAFISYNDPRSVHEKVNYVTDKGLGGVMIWHLALECLHPSGNGGSLDQCVPGQAGKNRPIMSAIRKTLHTGTGK